MDRYLIVNANVMCNNAVVIMDTETREFKIVSLSANICSIVPTFRNSMMNYEGDIITLDKSEGTIMYVDKHKKYYGILKCTKKGLNLYWIADVDITPETKNKLLNSSCRNAIVLDSFDDKMTLSNWIPKANIAIVKSLNRALRSKQQFKDYIEGRIHNFNEQPHEADNKVDDTKATEQNTASAVDNTVVDNAFGVTTETSGQRQIVKVPVAVNLDQEQLKRFERMDALMNKMDSLLSKLEGHEYEEAVATIVNVNDIYSFDDYADDEIKQSDIVYETLLKMASQYDSISISSEYFNKIKIYLKKTLTSSIDYSSYKAIALIRFESGSQFGILGLVDYTEGNELVRITILRRYNNRPITDEEVNRYYIHYEALRKKSMMSYR